MTATTALTAEQAAPDPLATASPDVRLVPVPGAPRRPTGPRVRPAPHREPPFDDVAPRHLHLVGPWDRRLPFGDQAVDSPAAVGDAGELPLPAHLPDPGRWARRLLIGIVEVAAGRRPLPQLGALLSPSVARGLATGFDRAGAAGQRHWTHAATVRSVHASRPADGVAELSASLDCGARVRAVALRLEERHGRWVCTRLQLG